MSYIDEKIIEMRCNRAYIKTIHQWVISQCPMLDEQVCLSRVLTSLDKKNLPYSRKEIRTAFMRYYNKEFHGDAQSYINWLSQNSSKKIVFPSKLKSSMKRKVEVQNKMPVAVTSGGYKARSSCKLKTMNNFLGLGCSGENMAYNPHRMQLEEGFR